MANYDFDAMNLNIDSCMKALKIDKSYLETAFDWDMTPQGADYWARQADGSFEPDARSTVAYFVAQSMEFTMSPFTAGMRF